MCRVSLLFPNMGVDSTGSALPHPHNKIYLHCLDEGHTRTSCAVNSAEKNNYDTFKTSSSIQLNIVVESIPTTLSASLAGKEDSDRDSCGVDMFAQATKTWPTKSHNCMLFSFAVFGSLILRVA